MHGEGVNETSKKLKEVDKLLKNAFKLTRRFPEFLYEGPLPSAFQEYAEAKIVEGVLANRSLPSSESLSISVVPYIMGLGRYF
ncbi:MAG: hypothetical protein QXK12_02990 [Candidatus Nezhaarchaeales archaeon]